MKKTTVFLLSIGLLTFSFGYGENPTTSYIVTPQGETSPLSDNKALVQTFYEAFSQNDAQKIGEILAQNYKVQDLTVTFDSTYSRYDAFNKNIIIRMKALQTALPHFTVTTNETIAEGNKVLARVQISGIQRGPFLGIEPTNKPVHIKMLTIFTIEEGKIVFIKEMWNEFSVMKQLGTIVL